MIKPKNTISSVLCRQSHSLDWKKLAAKYEVYAIAHGGEQIAIYRTKSNGYANKFISYELMHSI